MDASLGPAESLQAAALPPKRDYWHIFFVAGLVLRGLNGLWETLAGSFILLNSGTQIGQMLERLAGQELREDPNDVIVNFLIRNLSTASLDAKLFFAAYLLFHGLLNIFLVIQLTRDRLWAYEVAMAVILLSILYQIYHIIAHHSWLLALLTLLDLVFLYLTRHEYRRHARKIAVKNAL